MRRPLAIILCAVGAVFFFASLPFLGFAYFFYLASTSSLSGTIATTGTIVTTCNGNTSTTCHPIVSFRTQSGKRVQFSSNFSSSTMHEGDTVPVNYHPKDPQDAVISSFLSLWLFPVLLGSIGGFVLLIAIFLFIFALFLVFSKKRSRASAASPLPITPPAPPDPPFSRDFMDPSVSTNPTVPTVPVDLTAPSDAMTPTAPSAFNYPYHDPMNNNPYR